MPVQRYDIPVQGSARFEERRWAPTHSPILDADGNTLFIIQHADDVTQEHAAQERLAASERRFRALVEHATDLILVVGADRAITYQSPAARRLRELAGGARGARLGRPRPCRRPEDGDGAVRARLRGRRGGDGERARCAW